MTPRTLVSLLLIAGLLSGCAGANVQQPAQPAPVAYPSDAQATDGGYVLTAVRAAPRPPLAPANPGILIANDELARQEQARAAATATAAAPAEVPATTPEPGQSQADALATEAAGVAAAAAAPTPDNADFPAPEATPPPLVGAPDGAPFDWETSENYIVMGTDRRGEGGSWRTDSLMVIGLDKANQRAAVFSIPRDLYVSIPGYGYGRINQADYMGERRTGDGGGPQLVGSILESVLGIRVDHWVRIQMDGFIRFVDALGGVDIYLDCPFSEPIFNLDTQQWENFTLPAGANHLDGTDAYWFARLRYRETDIGRSSRQRAIIWALREKILMSNAIVRLPALYQSFSDTIETDLGLFDIIGLAQFAVSLEAADVRASGLTLRDLANYTTPGGAQVLVIGSRARVRALVEGVWDAPAMADAYRAQQAGCPAPQSLQAGATQDGAGEPVQMGSVLGDPALVAGLPPDGEPAAPPAFDPISGWPVDPLTGWPIDPATRYATDPVTGEPDLERGVIELDPETLLPIWP